MKDMVFKSTGRVQVMDESSDEMIVVDGPDDDPNITAVGTWIHLMNDHSPKNRVSLLLTHEDMIQLHDVLNGIVNY